MAEDPRYQLVLQWPASDLEDFDELVEIEDALIEFLDEEALIDGHDLGSGEMNIFILTDHPEAVFERVRRAGVIPISRMPTMSAGYRALDEDHFHGLWPGGSKRFTVK